MFNTLKNIAWTDRFFRRAPGYYARAVNQIEAFESSKPEERAALQQRRIARTLDRARRLSGYKTAPANGALKDWPILNRADIQGRENLYAEQTFYPAPKAETGGTTGQPLRLKRSIASIAFEQATIDRLCANVGVDARTARAAMLKADNLDPDLIAKGQYWLDIGSNKRVYSSSHMCTQTAGSYKQSLVSYAPEILFCYPSSVELLIKTLGENSAVSIPLVFTSSDILHSSTHRLIKQNLQCTNIDYYGHAERLVAAYNIDGGQYRFLPSYGHAELIPCADGVARIVATTLRGSGQIFVRYDTGDLARVRSHDPEYLEKVSLGLLPFDGIIGRGSECVQLSDGRHVFMVNTIARGADGANSIQLHFNGSDQMDIYIVPGPTFCAATCQHIVKNFYGKFPKSVGVNLWTVKERIREPNGKVPVLLRNPRIPEKPAQVEFRYPQDIEKASRTAA